MPNVAFSKHRSVDRPSGNCRATRIPVIWPQYTLTMCLQHDDRTYQVPTPSLARTPLHVRRTELARRCIQHAHVNCHELVEWWKVNMTVWRQPFGSSDFLTLDKHPVNMWSLALENYRRSVWGKLRSIMYYVPTSIY